MDRRKLYLPHGPVAQPAGHRRPSRIGRVPAARPSNRPIPDPTTLTITLNLDCHADRVQRTTISTLNPRTVNPRQMSGDMGERMDAVARRVDFLELLDEAGPLPTRDVVDALDHSRSTVTRALRTLREADLVEKRENGYVATLAGAMAAHEYRRYERTQRAVLASSDLLAAVPDAHALPVEALVGADTVVVEEAGPVRALEAVPGNLRRTRRLPGRPRRRRGTGRTVPGTRRRGGGTGVVPASGGPPRRRRRPHRRPPPRVGATPHRRPRVILPTQKGLSTGTSPIRTAPSPQAPATAICEVIRKQL
ncbi:hypothetical protein BRD00_10660 [Halobacteriales archaeon QS_8_69_26]|nr:MAG: hypothetical protein BRD00_10660 [Halobacteriales archaeon QS_8_69_26]